MITFNILAMSAFILFINILKQTAITNEENFDDKKHIGEIIILRTCNLY